MPAERGQGLETIRCYRANENWPWIQAKSEPLPASNEVKTFREVPSGERAEELVDVIADVLCQQNGWSLDDAQSYDKARARDAASEGYEIDPATVMVPSYRKHAREILVAAGALKDDADA